MNERLKILLIALAVLVLAGGGAWLWYDTFELSWDSRPFASDAARENRMLGATLLLRQNGHAVTLAESLGELALADLPDGTLIVGDASGILAPDKGQQLLAWVRRGNTLVAQPRWINPAEEATLAAAKAEEGEEEEAAESEEAAAEPAADESADSEAEDDIAQEEDSDFDFSFGTARSELVEVDPVAAHLGVRIQLDPKDAACHKVARKLPTAAPFMPGCAERQARLTLPGAKYALTLGPGPGRLISLQESAEGVWSDEEGSALRVYHEGRGSIVMVAADYFDNSRLKLHDHGELLLALAALNGGAKQVTIVKNLSAPRWYQALWDNYSEALLAIALTLALLLWATVRRFGPVLPEPDRERRSLIEHIDASGAWLWNAEGGRALLLEAARADTLALIRRRAPALLRLQPQERNAALARACGLPDADIDQALHQDAARHQQHFTRQIRTLQKMRNHYER